jgi:hypothetical protein
MTARFTHHPASSQTLGESLGEQGQEVFPSAIVEWQLAQTGVSCKTKRRGKQTLTKPEKIEEFISEQDKPNLSVKTSL